MALVLVLLTKTLEINHITTAARDAKKLTGFGKLQTNTHNTIMMVSSPYHHSAMTEPTCHGPSLLQADNGRKIPITFPSGIAVKVQRKL
jgi:hypothetical protein